MVLPPGGYLTMSRDILSCQPRESYWHLGGRGQGCCLTWYDAQDSSSVTENDPAQNVNNAKIEKHWLRRNLKKITHELQVSLHSNSFYAIF